MMPLMRVAVDGHYYSLGQNFDRTGRLLIPLTGVAEWTSATDRWSKVLFDPGDCHNVSNAYGREDGRFWSLGQSLELSERLL